VSSERKPRLLYVITLSETGGAQAYVRDLVRAMVADYDVSVGASGDGTLAAAVRDAGAEFISLRHMRRELSPVADVRAVFELARLCRRLRPDVIHLNSSKAGVLGRVAAAIARVPVVVLTANGWAFNASSGLESTLYRLTLRAVRPLTTMVVCVSEVEREEGLRARACSENMSVVIPNAVRVSGQLVRGEQSPNRVPVDLISVGRLADPKDFETLLEAFSTLPAGRARLTILGDGPRRGGLGSLAEQLGVGDSVVFAGEVADVSERLARADVFVLASRSEGMPISVLEGMAAGLPVVASAVGGVPEIVVDGETGYLVPAGDAKLLAERLESLVQDAGLRTRMGANGFGRVEELFSLETWRSRYLELYRSLLES